MVRTFGLCHYVSAATLSLRISPTTIPLSPYILLRPFSPFSPTFPYAIPCFPYIIPTCGTHGTSRLSARRPGCNTCYVCYHFKSLFNNLKS